MQNILKRHSLKNNPAEQRLLMVIITTCVQTDQYNNRLNQYEQKQDVNSSMTL